MKGKESLDMEIGKRRLRRNAWMWVFIGVAAVVCVAAAATAIFIQHEDTQLKELLLRNPAWYDEIAWKAESRQGKYTVREYPTTNIGKGVNEVKGVVLHHTACTTTEEAFNILSGRDGRTASSHVLIDTDGTRYLLASPETVTWHAGLSRLNGRDGANNFTIGIEFQGNTLDSPLTDAQIESGIDYLLPIIKKYGIPTGNIVTHENVRDTYKSQYPKNNAPRKVDITSGEHQRFMQALEKRLKETATK